MWPVVGVHSPAIQLGSATQPTVIERLIKTPPATAIQPTDLMRSVATPRVSKIRPSAPERCLTISQEVAIQRSVMVHFVAATPPAEQNTAIGNNALGSLAFGIGTIVVEAVRCRIQYSLSQPPLASGAYGSRTLARSAKSGTNNTGGGADGLVNNHTGIQLDRLALAGRQ